MLRAMTDGLIIAFIAAVSIVVTTFIMCKATSVTKESCDKAGWVYLESYSGIGKCVNPNSTIEE